MEDKSSKNISEEISDDNSNNFSIPKNKNINKEEE